ncbi:hypothetical protein ABIC08_009246 [Bradyrhizobium sp. RT9b]
MIEAAGILTPYSPNFVPVENAFAMLTTHILDGPIRFGH